MDVIATCKIQIISALKYNELYAGNSSKGIGGSLFISVIIDMKLAE